MSINMTHESLVIAYKTQMAKVVEILNDSKDAERLTVQQEQEIKGLLSLSGYLRKAEKGERENGHNG